MNKKLISVALAVATFSSMAFALPVSAQSNVQTQIEGLMAQIQALQGQLAPSTGTSSYNFTRDLTVGSKGADVTALQQVLINGGFLNISAPTAYFGAMTQSALGKWQASVGISPTAGYFGAKSRAYMNSMTTGGGSTTFPAGCTSLAGFSSTTGAPCAGSAGTTYPAGCSSYAGFSPTTGLPCAGTGAVVVPSSGLSVGLASDNPAAGTLISGAGRIPVIALNLSAGTAGAINVNGLKFTKTGVVSDSSISGAYLVQDGKVIAQYVSLGNGVITFSNVGLAISAGQTAKVWLALDVATGVSAGNTVGFRVASAADVSATDSANVAVTAAGNFPLAGNMMTVSSVSNPSLASMTLTSATVGASVFAGTQNVLVSQWTANVNNSAVNLSSLKFRVTGSATKSDLQNVKLYVNGAQVGSTIATLPSSGDAYFDLSSAPAKLSTGNSTVQVYADIMGSPSYTFQFQLLNSFDVYAVDTQYNTSITPTVSGGSGTLVTIQQGQLTVSLASDTPTGNLAKGQSNVTLAKFKIYAAGEAVKVKFLDFSLTFTGSSTVAGAVSGEIKNLALVDDAGGQIGTTINTPPTATTATCDQGANGNGTSALVYTDCFGTSGSPINYIVPANTTRVFALKGDIQTTANFTAVTAALRGQATANLQGLTSSATSISGSAAGSALSLVANSLTVAQNSGVGTQTFVKNQAGAKIGSYRLSASSAEGVVVSNLTVKTGQAADVDFQNLRVAIGSTQFGTSYSTLVGTTTYTFSGTAFTVPAGQSTVVDVYADVLTNATTPGVATRLSSCTATGATSNSSVSCSPTDVAGQSVTIGGSPSVTVSLSSAAPASAQLLAPSTGNSLAAFTFTETSNVEDLKITDLVVFQKTGGTAVKSAFSSLALYDGNTSLGNFSSVAATSNLIATSGVGFGYSYVYSFNPPVVVTKSSSKTLVLKGDLGAFEAGGITDVATTSFIIATSTDYPTTSTIVVARGNSSNNLATNVISAANGNTMTIQRNVLSVASAQIGASTRGGRQTQDNVATITLSAPTGATGDLTVNRLVLTVNGNWASSTTFLATGTAADDIKLLDNGVVVAGLLSVSSTPCGINGCTFTYNFSSATPSTVGASATGLRISPGSSKVLTVAVNTISHTAAATANVAPSMAVSIANTTDVNYTTAVDGAGIAATIPASMTPVQVASVALGVGQ